MTFEDALKAEIGDVLKASIPSSTYKEFEGDEVILIAKVRDYNGLENDTGGVIYNRRTGLVSKVAAVKRLLVSKKNA